MSSYNDSFVSSGNSPTHSGKVQPDFLVENHGSIFLLKPLTPSATSWIEEHIGQDNGFQPYFPTVVVERRYIIKTLLKLGEASWPIELALANRDQMGFRMLLGRTALEDRALIEPGRSYLLGARPARPRRRRKTPSLRASKLLR